jgi:hypothetical protein
MLAVFKKSAARLYKSISSLIPKRAQKTYSSLIETPLRSAAADAILATRDEIWSRYFLFCLAKIWLCPFASTNVLTHLQHHEPSRPDFPRYLDHIQDRLTPILQVIQKSSHRSTAWALGSTRATSFR